MSETRRKFDSEFRDEAVRIVVESGKSIASVASKPGRLPVICDHLVDIDASIRVSSLEHHVYELETAGYTLIENAFTPAEIGALTEPLLTLASEGNGLRPTFVLPA